MPSKTIPPISELRKICQSYKLERDKRWWRIFWRKISIYITWVLLHTEITPNQASATSVLLVILGTVLLAFSSPVFALCGALTYLIYHLIDKVDGEIARYYQKFSIVGVYLDELGHNLSDAGIFIGLGLHLAWQKDDASTLILTTAMIGALCMVMIRNNKSISFLLFAQNILAQPELLPDRQDSESPGILWKESVHQDRRKERKESISGGKRLLVWLRDFILAVSQSMVMFILVIAGLVVEILAQSTTFLEVLIKAEALLQGMVLVALVVINLRGNIQNECLRINELAEKKFDKQ